MPESSFSNKAYESPYEDNYKAARNEAAPPPGPSLSPTALGSPFVAWGVGALATAILCVLGWLYPEARPEPFEDPPPLLSLDWWRFAPADPAIADLDMVPVGNFGGFLPRAVARHVPIDLALVADEQVRPDGKEVLISLKGLISQSGVFRYSGDGGLTWRTPDDQTVVRCKAGQVMKIHSFQPGGRNIWSNCFPTPAIPGDDNLTGAATTAIFLGESAPEMVSSTAPEGIWLRAAAPYVVFTDRGASYPVEMPTKSIPKVLLPLPGNQVVVASAEGFTTITFPGDLNRDTTSNPFTGPLAAQRLLKGPLLAVSGFTPIQDPAHSNPSIRTLRMSKDGKSVVVAQDVAGDTGVLVSHDAGKNWSRLAYASGSAPWVVFIALPLALFSAAAAARQLIRTPAGQPSIADEAATDRPIGLSDVDTLQFEPIARGLLMFIRNPRTEPPVTIAVTGQWGSGKTSLMTILKDLLREYEARPVWFNAWHHQKEEHLLAALIENIRQQAIPSVGTWSGLFFRLRLLRRRLLGQVGLFLVLLAIVLVVIGAYLSVPATITKQWQTSLVQFYETTLGKKPADPVGSDAATKDTKPETKGNAKRGDDWLISLVALLPTGLAIPTLILGILKNLQPFPHSNPEQLLGGDRNKGKGDIASKLSFRYRFEREFSETAQALRNSASPGLVIFIDDLDRCHAQNVVELLEAVNFIVSAGACFVILGIAKEQIRRSILASYKSEFLDIPKESVRDGDREAARRRFADRYLEKLFNIEVPVPQPSANQIEALLTGATNRTVSVSDRPSKWRLIYENGPTLLAAALLFSLYIGLHSYLHKWGSQPALPTTIIAPDRPNDQAEATTFPASLTIPQVYTSDQDLAAVAPRAGFPLAQTILILTLLAAIGAYLGRLWVLAKRRPLSDSPAFRKALERWSGVIYLASRTPRAVKQYKNVLRYQAMRLRSLQASNDAAPNIPEADLVALGAIALVNRSLLTGAVGGSGKSIESLVAEATANSGDERFVLEEISRSLKKSASSGRLEVWITQYLELLPPQAQESPPSR
ncbi:MULTISPECIES: P-loop NTPase fold protein [unclassified Bradyrhizobium]|uniref:KAP family P-loop NTPase fold protein n=1 Tax=unclassified Bradyrhizobium TaxID=2631580 RepID=UPI0028E32B1D|nr:MULTISPECIES: P-loop NTPase fold protein [unclassified Bradyrhizobium]